MAEVDQTDDKSTIKIDLKDLSSETPLKWMGNVKDLVEFLEPITNDGHEKVSAEHQARIIRASKSMTIFFEGGDDNEYCFNCKTRLVRKLAKTYCNQWNEFGSKQKNWKMKNNEGQFRMLTPYKY